MSKATHRKISDESWAGAAAMAAHGGVLYIVHNETLYAVSLSAKEYRKVSDEAWSTRLMTSDGVHLYTIEGDGGLYRIRVEDGSYERINGDDWSSTVAIAVVDGKLWTADTSGAFYAVDLASGAWQQEKTAYDTSGVTHLAGRGTILHAFRDKGVMEVTWNDGSAGHIHTGEFPDAHALVACGDCLYLNCVDGHFYVFPRADKAKGQYFSPWSALDIDGAGAWHSALCTASRTAIYTLDETGGLYEIVPGE